MAALQDKFTCRIEAAVAIKLAGTEGGVVSDPALVEAEATGEKAPRLPAASVARTRYEYDVEAVSPVSLYAAAAGAAICTKFAQAAPWQRSTR